MHKRKVYASLAPLLVVAAFGVIPAMAHAEPHWYNNGKPVGEAPGLTRPLSGRVMLRVGMTSIECHMKAREQIWNPPGGGAGEDEVSPFQLKGCQSTPNNCAGQTQIITSGLPWPSHLVAGTPIRDAIEDIELEVKCKKGSGTAGLPWKCKGTLMPQVSGNLLIFGGPGSGELTCVTHTSGGGGTVEEEGTVWGEAMRHCRISAREDP